MPTFHFEAMDSTGETQTGDIEAATNDEAMQMLRERGLFVTKLSQEAEAEAGGASTEPPAAASDSVVSSDNGLDTGRRVEGQRAGLIVAVIGLVCTATGLYGVIDSALFSIRGKRVDATVVALEPDPSGGFDDVLEFTVAGRRHRTHARGAFGLIGGASAPVGSRVPVLYLPDHPEDARLTATGPLFFIPIFLLGFGLAVTGFGVLMRRHGWRPA